MILQCIVAIGAFLCSVALALVLSWWLAPTGGYEKVLPWLLAAGLAGAAGAVVLWRRRRPR